MLILAPIRQQNWSCNLRINLEEDGILPLSIGRKQDFGIPDGETTVSRKHAELIKDEAAIYLKALRKVWLKCARARKLTTVSGGETISVSACIKIGKY